MASPLEVLADFLNTSAPDEHVAHLQGPHGCGKSTQWLSHIWNGIRLQRRATLVYIQPTGTQVQLLTSYISTHPSLNSIKKGLDDERVQLMSFKDVVKMSLDKSLPLTSRLGPRATVCLDIEVTPSARGEYLAALFYNMAKAEKSLTVITMGTAGHRYPSFARPVMIQVEPPRELLPMTTLQTGPDACHVIWTVFYEGGQPQDRNVLLFTDVATCSNLANGSSLNNYNTMSMGLETCKVINLSRISFDKDPALVASLATLKGPALIQIEHDVEVRFPIRNVVMAVYQRTKEVTVLDNRSGLMVKHPSVVISKQELLGKQGLATYSSGPAMVGHYSYGLIGLDTVPDQPRPHAHSNELLYFCLLALTLSTHSPPAATYNIHPLLWSEALHVLKLMGLVGLQDRLNRVGVLTLNLLSLGMSEFSAAAFLAHMDCIPANPATKRVACIMAAILQASSVYGRTIWPPVSSQPGTALRRQTLRVLYAQCNPSFDNDRLWDGSLWVTVVLFEQLLHGSQHCSDATENAQGFWSLRQGYGFSKARKIHSLAIALASLFKSPAPLDVVENEEPEVLQIQRAMLSAYAYNVILLPSRASPSAPKRRCFSLSSHQCVDIDAFELTPTWAYVKNDLCGTLGLFTNVDLEQDGSYTVHGLMPLHCEAFDVFHDRIPSFRAGASLDRENLHRLIGSLMTRWGHPVMRN